MLIQRPADFTPSEITPESIYLGRRRFIQGLGMTGLALAAAPAAARLATIKSSFSTDESPNSLSEITTYNNFYEFGTDKGDPVLQAGRLKTRPWTVTIDGLVHKPLQLGLDDILKLAPLEERIYRLRCVEGWSMVIPWVGFPLDRLLKKVEPLSSARYVEFHTLVDKDTMPGVRRPVLDWPYVEGLRLDEARHPLTIMAVGLYGEVLPNQNGAPLRLVVPWKYGFKSGKSIVRIRFTDQMPRTTWNKLAPDEYGFFANVNPEVDHPRWSQAKERRIGDFFRRKTLMFNGYGDQVAGLYGGMDLKKYY